MGSQKGEVYLTSRTKPCSCLLSVACVELWSWGLVGTCCPKHHPGSRLAQAVCAEELSNVLRHANQALLKPTVSPLGLSPEP